MKKSSNINLSQNHINIESNEDISVDFSQIDNIALQDIEKISDIHRVAVLNGKKLYLKNASSEILNILAITGLHKSFKNFDDQYCAPVKRQRGF